MTLLNLTVSAPLRGTSSSLFKDAMVVRTEVFVHEQGVPIEHERDEDDKRSIHWVIYADAEKPVGVIRLVPAPHDHPGMFFKLGRLAVVKEYRGFGIGRMLVDAAVGYARENPAEVGPRGKDGAIVEGLGGWDGRCLVHAQSSVKGMWAKCGFVIDESMGEWDEEGMMHVGMWRDIGE